MEKVMKINLGEYEGPVYSGRDRGELVRDKVRLDKADQEGATRVEVAVPQDTYSVTSSFFLGLFGPSIVKAGSRDSFYQKYHFDAPPTILRRMDAYVERALQRKALFD